MSHKIITSLIRNKLNDSNADFIYKQCARLLGFLKNVAETHGFLVEHINKDWLLRQSNLVNITLLLHKHVATLDRHPLLDKFLRLKETLEMPHLPDARTQ